MIIYLAISTLALLAWIVVICNFLYHVKIGYDIDSWVRQYQNLDLYTFNRRQLIVLREKVDRTLARIDDE